MIGEFLRFEASRLFRDRRILGVGGLVLLVTVFLSISGVHNYFTFQKEKEAFQKYEKMRIPQYVNYSQYAALGFRVLFEPSPMGIFFESGRLLTKLESNVNMSELVFIYNVHKGRKLFIVRGYFSDVFGFLFITGTLLMVYAGFMTFPAPPDLALKLQFMGFSRLYWGTIVLRLVVIEILFSILLLPVFMLMLFGPVHFSSTEWHHLLAVSLLLLLLMAFFFVLGVFLKSIRRPRGQTLLWAFVFWFILTLLTPELIMEIVYARSRKLPTNESLNFQKLRTVLENEARAVRHVERMRKRKDVDMKKVVQEQVQYFMDNIHLLNRNVELNLTRSVKGLIRQYEHASLLIPTQFFVFVNREVSGLGYYGYLDFKSHIMHMQEKFMRYFFEQHYSLRKTRVESFIREDENVYRSTSYIPGMYWLGFLLTLLYTLILAGIGHRRYRRMVTEP